MKTVNVYAAKSQLSRLIEEAAGGEEIVIARAGKPVARIVALEGRKRRLGLLRGRLSVPADFDAPLPDTVQKDFEGS